MSRKKDARPLMNEMAEILLAECYVCGEKYYNKWGKPRVHKGWVVHHVWYNKNDLRYADFKNQYDYWAYLLPQVKVRHNDGFLLLCGKHHQTVERLANWNSWRFRRLLRAVERTRGGEPWGRKDEVMKREKQEREERERALQLRDA